jgi:arginase
MPLATALSEDNLEVQTNELDEKTEAYWEKLKNIGGISPKLSYDDLIYIGVRDTEAQEDYLIEKHAVRNITTRELRQIGIEEVVDIVNARLKNCTRIYISFDVDSLDPKISVGTGTPVPQGLRFKEARELLQTLCRDPRVCCLEFVEINPTLDTENAMAETAFKLLEAATDAALGA